MNKERAVIEQWGASFDQSMRAADSYRRFSVVLWILFLWAFVSLFKGGHLSSRLSATFIPLGLLLFVLACRRAVPFCLQFSKHRENSVLQGRPLCPRALLYELALYPFRTFVLGEALATVILAALLLILNVNLFVSALLSLIAVFAMTVVVCLIAVRSKDWITSAIFTGVLFLLGGCALFVLKTVVLRLVVDPATGFYAILPLKRAEQVSFAVFGGIALFLCALPFTKRWTLRFLPAALLVMGVSLFAPRQLPPVAPPTVSLLPPTAQEVEVDNPFGGEVQRLKRLTTALTLTRNSLHIPLLLRAVTRAQEAAVSGTSVFSPCFRADEIQQTVLTPLFPGVTLSGDVVACREPAVTYGGGDSGEQPDLGLEFVGLRPVVDYIEPLSVAQPFKTESWSVTVEKNKMAQFCWLRLSSEERAASLAALQTTSPESVVFDPPSAINGSLYLLIDQARQSATVLRKGLVPHVSYLQHEEVPCEVIANPERYSVARVSFIIDGVVQSKVEGKGRI